MKVPESFTQTLKLLLLYLSIASLLEQSQADHLKIVCSNTKTENIVFRTNLDNLMLSLRQNASVKDIYSTSSGNDTDKVYAQYLCYGNLTNEDCGKGIKTASEDVLQLCPNSTEAIVWEEACQLRYSNKNFLGHLDVSGNINQTTKNNVSDPESFWSAVSETLSDLTNKAAYNSSSNNTYATGKAAYKNGDTIYAMVQCTNDLSPSDCNTCLRVAMENISSCCYFLRGARILSRSCYLRYELYAFYEGAKETSVSQQYEGSGKSTPTWMIIIITLACAILVVAILGYLAMKKWRKENTSLEFDTKSKTSHHHYFPGIDSVNAREHGFMDLASIYAATDNFAESNMLGQGGFGPVYKGVLSDGQDVAVKKLSSFSEQGTEEFTNEVLVIMKLQHKNLVRLLGFCVDGEEKLLVYEFMPNGSLDIILCDPRKRAQLDWNRRINIVNGIAKGILYLHVDSRLRIIHRDLKASNILLDNDMNPKISDFGMARIFAGNDSEANTARIVGTYGYMPPEYAMEGLYSTKSDVFSFGVLLLEIITGRRNAGFHKSKRAPSLIAYVWQLQNEGNEPELQDPLIAETCNPHEFLRYIRIGLLCVQEDACDRPTMSSVVQMLRNETATLPQPERPALSVGTFTDLEEPNAYNCSVNNLTTSDIIPRSNVSKEAKNTFEYVCNLDIQNKINDSQKIPLDVELTSNKIDMLSSIASIEFPFLLGADKLCLNGKEKKKWIPSPKKQKIPLFTGLKPSIVIDKL